MTRTLTVMLLALILGAGVASAQNSSAPPPSSTPAAATQAPVNLNTATLAQLQTLPGVGRVMAERIIEYREQNGGFKRIEDLMNVRGIGEKNFLTLKPLIVVSAPPAP